MRSFRLLNEDSVLKTSKIRFKLNFTINCDRGFLFTKIRRLHFASQRQTDGVDSIQIWGRTVGKNVVTCAGSHLADCTLKRQKLIGHVNRNITGQTHLPDVTLSSPYKWKLSLRIAVFMQRTAALEVFLRWTRKQPWREDQLNLNHVCVDCYGWSEGPFPLPFWYTDIRTINYKVLCWKAVC